MTIKRIILVIEKIKNKIDANPSEHSKEEQIAINETLKILYKQIPKQLSYSYRRVGEYPFQDTHVGLCPSCKSIIHDSGTEKNEYWYCDCGQKLYWTEEITNSNTDNTEEDK